MRFPCARGDRLDPAVDKLLSVRGLPRLSDCRRQHPTRRLASVSTNGLSKETPERTLRREETTSLDSRMRRPRSCANHGVCPACPLCTRSFDPRGDVAHMTALRSSRVRTTSGNQTRSLDLREKIEEDIATGIFAPGSRLDETELAGRFGVSRTPVREALIQLASAGILELRPRRGAIVPELAPHRLIEMFEVMAELEAMCGRLAARRMSDSEHQELVATHKSCEAALKNEDPDTFYRQNEVLHHVIYRGSHNSFLAEQASALHKRLHPYRRLQLRVRNRMRASFFEHQQIVDAILAGNPDLAAEALRAHVLVQGERFSDLMAFLRRDAERGRPSVHRARRSDRRVMA
jgi:DNA-binding GntR family transcriptional regulator